jgi:neutral ceramidase
VSRAKYFVIAWAYLFGTASIGFAAEAAPFKAGFAERDITPDIGMEQPGGYGKAFHRTKHDACKVRASVFDDGAKRVAIVGVDALLIRRVNVDTARKAIQDKCGIPPDAVMIAASHSHSAGPTGMILPGEFDQASEQVKTLAYEKSSMANADYLRRVEQALIDAVVAADSGKVAARCGVGAGIEDKVAFNRRFRMAGGLTMTHPGQGNPDILEPAGPTDPQVGVLGAWSDDGKFLGCIVNFCCHATTGPGGISADYIHYIEKTIRGLMGDEAIVVFVPGMAGDVTQVDNRSPFAIKQFGEVSARFVGGRVGAEALKVLLAMEQGAGALAPVSCESRTLQIPRRKPRPERLARARELLAQDPQKVDTTEWTFAKEIVLLDARLAREPIAPVEVQAVQVGPAIFVSCPAEYFCQYGLDIKAGSRFPFTFPVSLANDCVGYVPTEEALGPRGGGYETRLSSYTNLEPAAGRKIADAAIDLTSHLAPGAVPQPPTLPAFTGQPWAYGKLPPELD